MDKTWAQHFNPETKLQSKAWKHTISPPTVNFHKIASGGKVVASVFWDSESVLMIEYLEKGNTVTGSCCVELNRKLHTAVKEKRRGK